MPAPGTRACFACVSPARAPRSLPPASGWAAQRLEPSAAEAWWVSVRDQSAEFFSLSEERWRAARRSGDCRCRPRQPNSSCRASRSSNGVGRSAGGGPRLVPAAVRDAAARAGGHATLMRGADRSGGVFTPLGAALHAHPSRIEAGVRSGAHIQSRAPVRRIFDPHANAFESRNFSDSPEGKEAAAIVRKCVHCGFCNATCPTYQLLGDELDGPRGRIYLIKQMLEGAEVTRSTQQHLDRCLTCLNCQTTCPSGVEYGHLVDIGRKLVEARVERPPVERAVRWSLKEGLTSSWFAPALRLGQALRPLLPRVLKNKVPARSARAERAREFDCPRYAAAQSADTARLRAARDVAQHRSGDRARARCGGHCKSCTPPAAVAAERCAHI